MNNKKTHSLLVLLLSIATATHAQSEKQWLLGDGFLYTDNTTQIGINTNAPQHELDVNGIVNAQSILVDGLEATGNWKQNLKTLTLESGNLGIGTATPTEKLTVAGIIHVEELKVDQTVPGPDYVFEALYELPSLREISTYIKKHGHLPYFPSAEAMEEKGIDLELTQMSLLRTLEEMVLHQIALQKRMEKLVRENEALEAELKEFGN